jgi:hypothetical protein
MARIAAEHKFTGTTGRIDDLDSPVTYVTPFGSTGSTTYGYRVTCINDHGESLPSATVQITNGNAALSASNFNRIVWDKVLWAKGYRVYGRTAGGELLLATVVNNNYFDDTGTVTPAGALPTVNTTGYSSSRTSIGTLIVQKSGPQPEDNWAGPVPVVVSRPVEYSTSIPVFFPHAIRWSTEVDWVFFADNSTATTNRRVLFYTYNRVSNVFSCEGFIIVTHPSLTNATVRGFRMTYDKYAKGSVAVSGTAVTGTGTTWSADRMTVGSRIGFGSLDPNYITRWYQITAIGSDTSITLDASAGVLAANTPYVIEDLRAVMLQTNSVAASGGLFVAKGLRPEIFTTAGITIPAATTTDNIRACYWLANAASVTNTTGLGFGLQEKTSYTSQNLYALDGTSACKVFVYNIRAPLTSIVSGKTTSAFLYETATQTLTGTAGQNNNGRLGTLNHGPGKDVECLYWTTTTRVYRAKVSDIVAGSAVWIADCMVEMPPGGGSTYPLTSSLGGIEIIDSLGKIILLSGGASGARSYVTEYQANVEQFDMIFGVDTRQTDQTSADKNAPIIPNINGAAWTVWSENGLTYLVRTGTTTALNHIYVVPFGVHWGLQHIKPTQRLITPAIPTPGAISYEKAVYTDVGKFGSDKFSICSEPVNMYYRVGGIEDNSGKWTLLDGSGDLSGVAPADSIQFMFEFKIIGNYCLPARILSTEVIYNTEDTLPPHLQWNFADSNNSNGTVGFIQKTAYGSIPNLEINYYRADNDINLMTQASSSTTNGVFEYWNGSSWVPGLGTDTVGLRRRFVPSSGLPASTNVYAKIKVI